MADKQPQHDMGAVLKAASAVPSGAKLVEYNPLENIPTLAVGDDIKEGMTLNGYFDGTEVIKSAKFTNSQERDTVTGLPIQRLHKLRLLDGTVIGIWNTGELKAVFEKLPVGEFISLTYKGKGTNAQGRAQHFFDYKRMEPNQQ